MPQPPNTVVDLQTGSTTVKIANTLPFVMIAGPCAMESRTHALDVAAALKDISDRLGIGLIYKSSFDKANRTSAAGPRGIGLKDALAIFAEIRETLHLPVITDIHERDHCEPVGEVVDVLQIPAFLCRQTDLLIAAAKTGRIVNIKKGQFLAPWDMKHVVEKVTSVGNPNVLVTERGASFGYNTLVSDFRSIPTMASQIGAPIIFDATHSVQQPGGLGGTSGGQRDMVPTLARAAIAAGVAGIFAETHPDPDTAPSDGPNMIPLRQLEAFIKDLQAIDAIAKARPSLHGFSE